MISLGPKLNLRREDIISQSIAVLGMTGMGKSNTVRRFAEQLLYGGLQFSLIDIENEYASLKEVGDLILAGTPTKSDRIVQDAMISTPEQAYSLAYNAYREKRSVVFMVGNLDDDIRAVFVAAYLKGLFEAGEDPDHRTHHRVIIEEAQEYVPQVGIKKDDPIVKAIIRTAKRGRKRGLLLTVTSQRSASVSKDLLSQCGIYILHRVTHSTDISTYKSLVEVDNLDQHLKVMVPGSAIYVNGTQSIHENITLAETRSPSTTPGAIRPERFQHAAGVEEFVNKVEHTESPQDIIVVNAADFEKERQKNVSLQKEADDLRTIVEELELKFEQLTGAIYDSGGLQDGPKAVVDNAEVTALKLENRRLTTEMNKLTAYRAVVRQLSQLVGQEINTDDQR